MFRDALAVIVACWHARVCSGGWDVVGGWGGVGGVGGGYVRHLEAASQAKRLWIKTNQKAAKQTIGAKWTQLIPPASGRNRLSRKTCR